MKEFGIVDDSASNANATDEKLSNVSDKNRGAGSGSGSGVSSGTGDDLAMDEEMIGVHFLEIPALYIMYVYVCTGKWFNGHIDQYLSLYYFMYTRDPSCQDL